MKSPNPINLMSSAEVRAAGWQAETRDADGHACRLHAPFDNDAEIVSLVREAIENGETVTIWPKGEPPEATPSPISLLVGSVAMPETPPHEALKAVAWLQVDPASRTFEDTKGEVEIVGYARAEEIYRAIRAALASASGTEERAATDNRHEFVPNKKYPWFCACCGYAPHEPLKHFQPVRAALSAPEAEG